MYKKIISQKASKKIATKEQTIFDYPFNYKLLSTDLKKTIIKLQKKSLNKNFKLYILSGSTISTAAEQIKLFCLNYGINLNIKIGEYNRFYEEVVFGKEIINFNPDWIYLHTNIKNITNFPNYFSTQINLTLFYKDKINQLKKILETLTKENKKIIVNNYELPEIRFNSLSLKKSSLNILKNLNRKIIKLINNYENVYLNDLEYLSAYVGIKNWVDNNYWAAFKIAFSPLAIPYLGSSIASIIASSEGLNKKVLICDLDNTLWGGIIGEVGFKNIDLGPENVKGEIFCEIQKYIKSLSDKGIILAVVSKNNEKNAKEGFKNKFSILKIEDFVIFHSNWKSKSINILDIKTKLNVGEDSIVFIDDNPAELEEVKSNMPLITTIGYKKNPLEIIMTIEKLGYFNTTKITKEDIKRNSYYRQNFKSIAEQNTFNDYGKYLKNLNMTAKIQSLENNEINRAVQLINKTNQFNLTQKKTDIKEFKNFFKNKNYFILQSNLKDKYGDNGIVTILYGFKDKKIFKILNWVMSCRVFKRELELAIVDYLVNFCKKNNLEKITLNLIKNEKNIYIHKLFDKLNFSIIKTPKNKTNQVSYVKFITNKYNNLNSHIKLK